MSCSTSAMLSKEKSKLSRSANESPRQSPPVPSPQSSPAGNKLPIGDKYGEADSLFDCPTDSLFGSPVEKKSPEVGKQSDRLATQSTMAMSPDDAEPPSNATPEDYLIANIKNQTRRRQAQVIDP